jgi:metal-responsive CopG/Arc/MetJ family transcriptional regulator
MKTKNMKKQDTCGGARKGIGRPNRRQMKTKSISMPDHLWLRLDEVRGKLSRSAAIRRFLTDYGDNLMRKLQAEREMRYAQW